MTLGIWASSGNPASSRVTLWIWPGRTNSGAISLRGCSTKRLTCARGWGKLRLGVARLSGPKAIRSRSSGRGSFKTFLGCRPNSFSMACSLTSRVSGVSSARGVNPTTAFTNCGEPAGQSTGLVCHREDLRIGPSDSSWSRRIARRTLPFASPTFAPNATNATPLTEDCGL